jgi:predicted porin
MKKTLLTIAVLSVFASAAQAQTSVMVYGSFDAGIRNLSNTNAAGDSRLTMSSTGTYKTNRLGFRGTEDLGGGLNAHFKLESGFNSGTGALAGDLFGRTALVGLGGDWGSFDFGRQYSVAYLINSKYEPFSNSNWTGFALAGGQGGVVRNSNDIQYTGNFGPLTVMAEYALGEVAGSTSAGASAALGGNYVAGPFNFGGTYTARKNAANTARQKSWSAGGAYSSGPFRLAVGYGNDDRDPGFAVAAATNIKDVWVGGTYNITPAVGLGAAYYRNSTEVGGVTGRKDLLLVSGTYALSKRTSLYAGADIGKFSGTYQNALFATPTGQSRQTGISTGISHLF